MDIYLSLLLFKATHKTGREVTLEMHGFIPSINRTAVSTTLTHNYICNDIIVYTVHLQRGRLVCESETKGEMRQRCTMQNPQLLSYLHKDKVPATDRSPTQTSNMRACTFHFSLFAVCNCQDKTHLSDVREKRLNKQIPTLCTQDIP